MLFIESPLFTKQVKQLLTDDEYRLLQAAVVAHPDAGVLMQGTGGLRKLRWSAFDNGKSGGIRVIYYWVTHDDQIRMLLIYRKGIKDDLTPKEKQVLRTINENWRKQFKN
jgi:mRNA-degrading endonuclease RelE of RelBE toxin-antitoxin system